MSKEKSVSGLDILIPKAQDLHRPSVGMFQLSHNDVMYSAYAM